jgi:DNA invertase Pin-like site-specific DNA recombinase
MSTDFQKYSIQNQAVAIAAFAQQSNLTIVKTYVDEGRSGLRIKGRAGLIQLIDDVNSGQTDFDHILVYDVSRWGRFQDVDESAYYEFVCKQKGIRVTYCAEQFDNDGSLLSSIVKNIKRVMAAEYSRELSVKVHVGQCRIAGLGYRVGGPLGYGLRREMVDETQRSKGQLKKGERKSLQTDRVRICCGSEEEAAVIRWIFRQFVVERQSDTEIARQLTQQRVPGPGRRRSRWNAGSVHTILGNEIYIGNLVHNRRSRRLGQKLAANPRNLWVRRDGVIDPIVDAALFARAQKLMAERRLEIPEDQMLRRLRLLLHRKGKLTSGIIAGALDVSCVSSLAKHFGSLRKAFALIGYVPEHDCDWMDNREAWNAVQARHAAHVADALRSNAKRPSGMGAVGGRLTIDGRTRVTFLVARQGKQRKPGHATYWRVYRGQKQSGLLAVLRLDKANRAIEDYVLIPAAAIVKNYLRFSNRVALPGSAVRFDTLAQLTDEVSTRFRPGLAARKRSVITAERGRPDRR